QGGATGTADRTLARSIRSAMLLRPRSRWAKLKIPPGGSRGIQSVDGGPDRIPLVSLASLGAPGKRGFRVRILPVRFGHLANRRGSVVLREARLESPMAPSQARLARAARPIGLASRCVLAHVQIGDAPANRAGKA